MIVEEGGRIATRTASRSARPDVIPRGDAGQIEIVATEMTVNGGQILSTTSGPGDGGNVLITADSLSLTDGGSMAVGSSDHPNEDSMEGDAGRIELRVANTLRVADEDSLISSDTSSSGSGGSIFIWAGQLEIVDNALIAVASTHTGDAGSVQITADNVSLTTGGSITVGSTDTGDAGRIHITVTDTLRSDNGAITTESARARGGDITLEAQNVFLLDSTVTAEAMGLEPGTSDGGNITVQGQQVVFNQSCIQANAFGGSGGNIQIMATDVYLASLDTVLDASSELGLSGSVDIASPVVELTGAVAPLTSTFDAAETLLHNHCAVHQREEKRASFIAQGRDRITIAPDGILPSSQMPMRFP